MDAKPVTETTGVREELFIGGSWRPAASGRTRPIVNPATGNVIANVAEADASDVDGAVSAARSAFDGGEWAALPGRERARVLLRIAELLRKHGEEFAEIESQDVGKPITFARMIDVNTVVEQYEYYAGLAQSIEGSTRQLPFPSFAYVRREPIGVIGAITPFNFPLILSNAKLAPALAAGNTIVHKPADDTPLSALRMAELFAEAGLPDGVINVVTGAGAEAGEALLRHPGVDKIAFTGSTAVGRHAAAVAGEGLKSLSLELGGNGAHVVFEDADVENAIGTVIKAFVFNTGQFCMAGPRLIVARPLYDTILGAVSGAVGGVPLGDPLDEATVIGPLAGQRHLDKVAQLVEEARAAGATIAAGGHRIDRPGFFYAPTVVADVPNDAAIVQEEIFGPVVTVQPFDTEDEAISLANSTSYGLAAGLHTTDLKRAHRVAAKLRAGIVWVNDWAMLDPSLPFGGVKQSGYGREHGPEALEAYTVSKSVVISLA